MAKVIDMNEFYLCLHEEERDRIKKLEPFDEFEVREVLNVCLKILVCIEFFVD